MNTLKFLFFGAALCFFGFCPSFCDASTLIGPEAAKVGDLTTVVADESGEWLITPAKGIQFAKDTGGKILYVVAQNTGEYTIIFFGVKDGKPVLSQKPLTIIGDQPDPDPEPAPEPIQDLTDAERAAVKNIFETVLDGIKNSEIKTPAGARSMFKQMTFSKCSICSGGVCHLSSPLQNALNDWTKRADFSTLETTKTSFEEFKKELE